MWTFAGKTNCSCEIFIKWWITQSTQSKTYKKLLLNIGFFKKKIVKIIVWNFELDGSVVVILGRSILPDYYKLITNPLLINLTRWFSLTVKME